MKNHKNTERIKLRFNFILALSALIMVSSCTKKRAASLPDDAQSDIFAISEFGKPTAQSGFTAQISYKAEDSQELQALDANNTVKLSADDVKVPDRLKFMFDRLPMINQSVNTFKMTFTVDRNSITAYKIADDISQLTAIEKSLAISEREAQLMIEASKSGQAEANQIIKQLKSAQNESLKIKKGQVQSSLLVPLFKYKIVSYGILERTKNDLKEETAVLRLKPTDFRTATHIQISSLSDAREVIGLKAGQSKTMSELFNKNKLDHRLTTAEQLASELKIGLKFIQPTTQVLTKVNDSDLLIYEITTYKKLSDQLKRNLINDTASGKIKRCSDADVKDVIRSNDPECVIVVTATVQLEHVKPKLAETDSFTGSTSSDIELEKVTAADNSGLVQILQNTPAAQTEIIDGLLDPNSTLKISELSGEFFFRRTLEDAASSFLGRTGTSGDMAIVRFELEDERIVVRNQQSLIQYTGQGAKDKEEILSIPVTYFRAITETAAGAKLAIPKFVVTTKEKAEYAKVDWTRNSVPDASSPLAFYDAGSCFIANSSQKVTATDMRLSTEGVLNFSIASSYTVDPACAAIKDVNSAYWAGMAQFNYNVQERISFVRHTNKAKTDQQFALNISPMAQEAFNFGVFTLADKITNNGSLSNRDGSEKYMPMIHDFRNGRIIKWYLGGINDPTATNAERRKLLVEAATQVVKEWNASFRMSFKGTALERKGDYIQLIIEEPGQETGRLGDLDKNYIWFNEVPSDNGLLGVAQPAANPRSGVVESANVIVYTGNTFQQTENLIKSTRISRQYEKLLEEAKKSALAEAQKQKQIISSQELNKAQASEQNKVSGLRKNLKLESQVKLQEANLKQMIKSLDLDQKKINLALKNLETVEAKLSADVLSGKKSRSLHRDIFKGVRKGQKINYPLNSKTFTHKLTELAMDKSLKRNPKELEFKMNDVFLTHAGLSELTRRVLSKRQAQLSMSLRFDRAQQNRPGCFMYARNTIEDHALNADEDPYKNLMINFKQAVMSTLSHELGHAFGLLHNFTASTDSANYEFPGEKTGRNYSSIMDYITDIEQNYAGPGPYDVHAIRAAYTGYVPLNLKQSAIQSEVQKFKAMDINVIANDSDLLIAIPDAAKALGHDSLVHFNKDTVNQTGFIKYFAQCHDGYVGLSALCAMFDTGGSPQEIVMNKIADYTRSYANRNYVYDRINFNWNEKVQTITRNISLFEDIRGFLDETLSAAIYGSGRGEEADRLHLENLFYAAMEGYKFFHEVVRIPDVKTSLIDVNNRLYAVPYVYEMEGQQKEDIKILEARPLYDIAMTKDKLDTIGIGYDKMFAMNFLLLASEMTGTDDSQVNFISYTDFEKFFLGVEDPAASLTIQTAVDILSHNLKAGFFDPAGNLLDVQIPVETNQLLGDQTAIAAILGMNQAKWSSFDPFAESLLVGRATVNQAPQDRINVARFGQNRQYSDTSVYYAGQNSKASQALILLAARAETLIDSKKVLYPQIAALIAADRKVKEPIALVKAKACELDPATGEAKDLAACQKAQALTDVEYVQQMPELKEAKDLADAEARKVVDTFRKLNVKDILLPARLDQADSEFNFESQVEIMREQLFVQLSMIGSALNELQNTPAQQLQMAIPQIIQLLQSFKDENDQLSVIPAMSVAIMYMSDATAGLKVTLQDNRTEITGSQINELMMNAREVSEKQAKLTDVIDQLSLFSRLVDPDLAFTK